MRFYDSSLSYSAYLVIFILYLASSHCKVYGDKAMVTLDNLRASAVTVHSAEGEIKDCIYDHFSSRFKEAYYSELDHFIDFLQACLLLLLSLPPRFSCPLSVLLKSLRLFLALFLLRRDAKRSCELPRMKPMLPCESLRPLQTHTSRNKPFT